MDLTAWQRICHRLLGGVFKKRARADKELSDNLVKASMPMMPEVYMATVFVTTIVNYNCHNRSTRLVSTSIK